MKPTKKIFRVEIGVNMLAAPMPQTNPNMRVFPLQNALINLTDPENPGPAWYFHLNMGDEISFRVVDLTGLRVPSYEPDYPTFALAELYFNNPITGRSENPFSQEVAAWRFSERLDDQCSPAYSLDGNHHLPTWDIQAVGPAAEIFDSLTFAEFKGVSEDRAFRAFELTAAIKLAKDGWVNHYVFDPEMIISETDSEGDGSGGK